MVIALSHRGPDSGGYFRCGDYNAGMRRLAINDVAHGDQPLYSADRDVVLLYNGEIYNYAELRRELEAKGHRFRTKSDGEVICHLYEYHREAFSSGSMACLLRRYGSSASASSFWRGIFPGEKPLYYSESRPGKSFSPRKSRPEALSGDRSCDRSAGSLGFSDVLVGPGARTATAQSRRCREATSCGRRSGTRLRSYTNKFQSRGHGVGG